MADEIDKSALRVRRMFGQIAPRYDLVNHLLSLSIDRHWRRRAVRLVPPRGSEPILDVCTGTADLALAYRRISNETTLIVGADFCRPMLAVADRKCRRQNALGRVHLVEADALRLPFHDNTFQVVSVAFGLRNMADPDAGLAEMTRVCRPEGRVAVLEFSMASVWPLGTLYRWYFRRLLPWVGQAVARNDEAAYNYLPASVGAFPEREALAERMRAAGLRDVWFSGFTFGISTLYVGEK
jgi:demethylmenaquinone methyltransferase / 2-methoxy-6-polyprenyl-1,4-benzoquinol methylase